MNENYVSSVFECISVKKVHHHHPGNCVDFSYLQRVFSFLMYFLLGGLPFFSSAQALYRPQSSHIIKSPKEDPTVGIPQCLPGESESKMSNLYLSLHSKLNFSIFPLQVIFYQ